ncbi:MAG: hypothetical protein JSV61_02435 [Anaerolineales bacterium]|nr:MAG: hypothetical protein JSV61_02435 [Anaerolineales bacterium]
MTVEQNISVKKERQRLEGLWWAVALIWAGLVFGADSMGILPQIGEADAWSWIFLGAGLLGMLGNLYRVVSSEVPNPTTWDWVWSGIILILGLGGFTALNISWSLILILVGGVILVSVLWRRE